MSKLKCQIKSKAQMTKFIKKKEFFDIESFDIHLTFGFWHLKLDV